jgi:hypothetical protein
MSDGSERLVVRPVWPEVGDTSVVRLLIAAFDPGVTTGWAALRLDLGLLTDEGFAALALRSGGGRETDLLAWDTGVFRGGDGACAEQMLGLVRGVWEEGEFGVGVDSDVMGIAQEDFILRMLSADRDLLSPVRINAIFDHIARPVPVPRRKQQASDAKRVVSDDRLHRMNLWRSGWTDHEKDALRHAVLLARSLCEPEFLRRWCAACTWLRSPPQAAAQ